MQIFLAIDGEKTGPFSLYKVREMLDDEEITPETLCWHADMPDWQKIKTLDFYSAFKAPPTPEPSSEPTPQPASIKNENLESDTTSPSTTVTPYVLRRLLARAIDLTLVTSLCSACGWWLRHKGYLKTDDIFGFFETILLVSMLVLIPIEALLLAKFNTTVGKFLTGIRIINPTGTCLHLSQAIIRSSTVGIFCLTIYLPFVIWISVFIILYSIFQKKLLPWDIYSKLQIKVKPLQLWPHAVATYLRGLAFMLFISYIPGWTLLLLKVPLPEITLEQYFEHYKTKTKNSKNP